MGRKGWESEGEGEGEGGEREGEGEEEREERYFFIQCNLISLYVCGNIIQLGFFLLLLLVCYTHTHTLYMYITMYTYKPIILCRFCGSSVLTI